MFVVRDDGQAPEWLKKLLVKIAKEQGFAACTIEIRPVSSDGGSYMGDLFTADVVHDGRETLHLFAKVANTPAAARDDIPARLVYEREVFSYGTLREHYRRLYDDGALPAALRFRFPDYYGHDLTELEEAVVFGNLTNMGYGMYERRKPMTWEFAKLAIEELAKFHALSHALRLRRPDTFDSCVRDNMYHLSLRKRKNPDALKAFVVRMIKTALASLDPRYHVAVSNFFRTNPDYWSKQHETGECSVICHGDYRISNLMVKYKDSAPFSLLAIDYQCVHYGNGLNDLLYLIYTGGDSEFRRRHLADSVRLYRAALGDHLRRLGHDLEHAYPQTLFDRHVDERKLYGLAVAVLILPVTMVEASAAPRIEELLSRRPRGLQLTNDLYSERVNGIFRDLEHWGAIEVQQTQ